MPQRRTFRDAGPSYNRLREGLPEAIHKTLFETRDISDAIAWLTNGKMPDEKTEPPAPGARIAQPGRFLINAIGMDKDGTRWVETKRQRYDSVKELTSRKWDNDFLGFGYHGTKMRGQVRTTGRGNSRRYHVWWECDESGRPTLESMQLFRYERPAPVYEMDAKDPARESIPLNEAQLEIVKILTER